MQVDPKDTVTWVKYKIEGKQAKRSNIPDNVWDKVINEKDALIIVDKHKKDKCFGEKRLDAMNDVCHIIGLWYGILLEDYNKELPDDKKFKNFGGMYDQIAKNKKVEGRISGLIRNYGMTVQDIKLLFGYKTLRNRTVHKNCLNRGATASVLSQQVQNSLQQLHLAPDQPPGFSRAFEKCAKWVYKKN
ncbi:hypothetical protein Glove_346g25 [Diversispora epigaea]|uniref:Uncharacterized protein n=1 Tax=Diversispora epigaea TaxID=1348612 RepID=A0A397HF91_9GLOM|nr:hypothetical protein Glove_346g25 [Diversispora epigaea]